MRVELAHPTIQMELDALRVEHAKRLAFHDAERAKVVDWIHHFQRTQEATMARIEDIEKAIAEAKTDLGSLGVYVGDLRTQRDQANATSAAQLETMLGHVYDLHDGIKGLMPAHEAAESVEDHVV